MSSSKKDKKKNKEIQIKEIIMDNKVSCSMSRCPMGGFCWKNPVHWFFGLAVLPFALDGLRVLWGAIKFIAG